MLFFLFRTDGLTRGWADTPYYRALEEARTGALKLPELKENERLLLQLVLVRAENAMVEAIRVVSLGPKVKIFYKQYKSSPFCRRTTTGVSTKSTAAFPPNNWFNEE